jgi:outer membrane receptor protein involved in Fe transport
LRLIAGVFTDDTDSIERGNWIYPHTIELGFATKTPHPTAVSSDPTERAPGVAFFNDFTRGKEEISFFGEFAFDITESITATIGARNYDIDISLTGSTNGGTYDGRFNGQNVTVNLASESPRSLSDTIYKANLQWFATDDVMFYATWSEGYRPGGFNRDGGRSAVAGVPPFIPFFYESDELENIEFGWKTSLLDGSLRFNGSIYSLKWDNMQVSTLDFDISILTFVDNSADAEIQGLEVDLVWAPTDALRLFANVSYNDTEITRVPPTITSISPVGSQLALAPKLQYALRARYDWTMNGDYEPFAQVGLQFSDDTPSSLVIENQFQLADYTTFDASFGVRKDDWSATLFIENISDERADIFIGNEDNIVKTTTNRPRTIGLRFSYNVGD